MTVKVGQVYFHKRIEAKIVITYVDNQDYILCDWIVDTGKVCTDKIDWIKQTCKLIAEYESWQQAVNSPEFKGEK